MFALELRERELVPEHMARTEFDVVEELYDKVGLTAMILKILELDESAVRRVHTDLCERYGIASEQQFFR